MYTFDQIMFTGCWLALLLYVLTTLAAFTRPSCISYVVSFLSACILWLALTIFNAWFFLPAFIYHLRESNLHADSIGGFFRTMFTSEPAKDVYLVGLGSFGSWLAVFNAVGMLQTEGYLDACTHGTGGIHETNS